MRFPWDVVLEEDEPTEDARRMRERRKLEESSRSEGEWTELSDDIIVWEGIAKYQRGRRRKDEEGEEDKEDEEGATVPEAMDGDEKSDEPRDPQEKEESEGFESNSSKSEETLEEDADKEERTSITSGTATPKRVFKGELEEAKKLPPVKKAFTTLKRVFGGHYITSNAAEARFNVKPPLKAHRTMKSGNAFTQMLLFLRTKLKKKSRGEIKSFFRNEVATFERLRKVSVRRKGPRHDEINPKK